MSIGSLDTEAALREFIRREIEGSRVATVARQLQNPAAPAAPAAHAATHQDGGADVLTVREAMMAAGATGLAKGEFSAYRNAAVSRASGTTIVFDTEERDVSGWFDPATGRYTPLVAGYYRLGGLLGASPGTGGWIQASLFKNGVRHKDGTLSNQNGTTGVGSIVVAEVQANGTTDFFELVIFHSLGATAMAVFVGANACYFQGSLIGRS